jgi:D-3-phosphoglycerate dehydrogenase
MTTGWRVLVIEAFDPAGMELLSSAPNVTVDVVGSPSEPGFDGLLKAAHGVTLRMTPFPAELIQAAPSLRVVSRHGVGYDTVDVEALTRRRIPLAVVNESNPATVAEHTLALMLALARHLKAYDSALRAGDFAWRLRAESVELFGKTVLLVGFGRIGREVARRCAAFSMEVLVYDPHVPTGEIARAGGSPAGGLMAALGAADFVSLHAPLGPETRSLINAQALACMKPGAILVNTARGGLIDEPALAAALAEGRLAGAGLDVFAPQPPAPDNPLLGMDNVILTPHSAGMTREGAARIGKACAQNVLDGLEGRLDPGNVVNPETLEAEASSVGAP